MPESKKSCLPAFACIGEQIDLWPAVDDGLTYAEATAEGRDRAEQLLGVMRRTGSPTVLGHVMGAMIARGQHGGVEIGFSHVLAVELMVGLPVITEFVQVPMEPGFPVGRKLGCLRMVG